MLRVAISQGSEHLKVDLPSVIRTVEAHLGLGDQPGKQRLPELNVFCSDRDF